MLPSRYTIKQYFRFLSLSGNQHAVHSPFVFNFVTRCLYDKTKYPAYAKLNTYRKRLLNDQNSIEITDFGAGSRVFKDNTRKIADLAKNAGASTRRMRLLYRVTHYFQPENSLELGTSLGLATASIGLGKPGKLISLEGCPALAKTAQNKLKSFNFDQVTVINTRFSKFIENTQEQYDLIYFDGNHSKKATLHYFEELLTSATNDSVWIFDDIYWSPQMTAAWEIIKDDPRVQVTVDCFWLGFVFFRKEQEKEHFKIRL